MKRLYRIGWPTKESYGLRSFAGDGLTRRTHRSNGRPTTKQRASSVWDNSFLGAREWRPDPLESRAPTHDSPNAMGGIHLRWSGSHLSRAPADTLKVKVGTESTSLRIVSPLTGSKETINPVFCW